MQKRTVILCISEEGYHQMICYICLFLLFCFCFLLDALRAAWIFSKYEVDVLVVRDIIISAYLPRRHVVRIGKKSREVRLPWYAHVNLEGTWSMYVWVKVLKMEHPWKRWTLYMDSLGEEFPKKDFRKWIPRLGLHGENQFAMSTPTVEMWGKAER